MSVHGVLHCCGGDWNFSKYAVKTQASLCTLTGYQSYCHSQRPDGQSQVWHSQEDFTSPMQYFSWEGITSIKSWGDNGHIPKDLNKERTVFFQNVNMEERERLRKCFRSKEVRDKTRNPTLECGWDKAVYDTKSSDSWNINYRLGKNICWY